MNVATMSINGKPSVRRVASSTSRMPDTPRSMAYDASLTTGTPPRSGSRNGYTSTTGRPDSSPNTRMSRISRNSVRK